MLAGTGLGDDALLAHAPGEHGLADDVVDLVRTGVVEVFALQENLGATLLTAHARGVVDRAGSTHEMREFALELGDEVRVVLVFRVRGLQLVDGVREGFAHETAAVAAEVAAGVGLLVGVHGVFSVRWPEQPRRWGSAGAG
ncbi:hypothetical protein D9M69_621530 [compost metagenome]